MLKEYYQLTKPGIIYGNAITAIAGFFLAEKGHFNLQLFLAMLVGISLIIASACVLNNYYDQEIDRHMARTKNRAMASGQISNRSAIIFAAILGVIGGGILFLYTNLITYFLGLLGFVVYVLLYTPLKSKTVYATLIGSISGAVPITAGYTAVTNRFDTGAIILFLILIFWQMPHFYAIAIRRLEEYKAASIPVLPIKQGIRAAKIQIVFYIIAFTITALLLSYFKFTGYTYAVIVFVLGLMWLRLALMGLKSKINNIVWARKVFLFSLITLTTLSLILALNQILP